LYLKKFSEKSDIEILKFFEINYINNRPNEISDWDCSERVLKGIPLTTNICEGFNRSLNALFKSCHPNLIKLIITLRTQDHLQDQKIISNLNFKSSRKPDSKTIRKLSNLKTIIARYFGSTTGYATVKKRGGTMKLY
ncbi:hypothetical protein DMUE_1965, partial [Dictyocoela muelleri]